MTYDPHDEARDEMYEQIARELYPDHKAQAITEFTTGRLQSYYVANPNVMRPALDAIHEGERLEANGHFGGAIVYFVIAIELLLKSTLLKPVVLGLVHSDALAEVIVERAVGPSGFDRYSGLLARLFLELFDLDIKTVHRPLANEMLLIECGRQQKLRNQIIHQGATATRQDAELTHLVSVAVYELVVLPMLDCLGLWVIGRSEIQIYPSSRNAPG